MNKKFKVREHKLIDENMPFSVVEAYKAIRTNLIFVLGAKNINSTVFTSYGAMEGKTSTCANLAITFAQSGAKVLLIDADMRKPQLHRLLGCNMTPGLSEVLCGVVDDNSIQKTNYDNLYVMTCGKIPPNPADLLLSTNLDKLIESMSKAFDYVFFDAPPVGLVTDGAIIARKLGGAIVTVRSECATTEDVRETRDALAQAGTEAIGYILTDVKDENRRGYRAHSASYRKYYTSY